MTTCLTPITSGTGLSQSYALRLYSKSTQTPPLRVVVPSQAQSPTGGDTGLVVGPGTGSAWNISVKGSIPSGGQAMSFQTSGNSKSLSYQGESGPLIVAPTGSDNTTFNVYCGPISGTVIISLPSPTGAQVAADLSSIIQSSYPLIITQNGSTIAAMAGAFMIEQVQPFGPNR